MGMGGSWWCVWVDDVVLLFFLSSSLLGGSYGSGRLRRWEGQSEAFCWLHWVHGIFYLLMGGRMVELLSRLGTPETYVGEGTNKLSFVALACIM
jgi:hypothetical protein